MGATMEAWFSEFGGSRIALFIFDSCVSLIFQSCCFYIQEPGKRRGEFAIRRRPILVCLNHDFLLRSFERGTAGEKSTHKGLIAVNDKGVVGW